ncbi:Dephospho-CoA kinase [Candidatus Hepatincolaceae symbiont of Richtersius coronifer]
MIVIGVTGGISSGKSTICKLLVQKGCIYFDSDSYVKILLQQKKIVKQIYHNFPQLKEEKFKSIYQRNNPKINKALLKEIIFSDYENNIKIMENIMHPLVYKKIKKLIFANKVISLFVGLSSYLANKHVTKYLVLEVPLLFESQIDKLCNLTLGVTCTKENQIKRALYKTTEAIGNITLDNLQKVILKQQTLINNLQYTDFLVQTDKPIKNIQVTQENNKNEKWVDKSTEELSLELDNILKNIYLCKPRAKINEKS